MIPSQSELYGKPLGSREIQVLRLMADGLETKAIADRLILGVNTIKTYKRTINEKFGVHSSTHAVACGFRQGYLSVELVPV